MLSKKRNIEYQQGYTPLGASCYKYSTTCQTGAGCNQGICQCSNGYVQAGQTCILRNRIANRIIRPGAQCVQGDFCDGGSVCLNSVCQCPPGLSAQPICTPIRNNCSSIYCPPPSVCVNGTCYAPITQSPNNSFQLYPGLSCVTNPNICTGGSYCLNGVCVCPTGHIIINGTCTPPTVNALPGESCSREPNRIEIIECTGNSICANGYCVCPNGESIQNGVCISINSIANPGESCVENVTNCTKNSYCIGGICRCQMTQILLNGYCAKFTVIPANPNDPCSSNTVCSGNSYCNSNRCTCIPGYYYNNGQCIPYNSNQGYLEPGASCGSNNYQSCVPNSQCQESICICNQGYVVYESSCVPFIGYSDPGEACTQPGIICIGGATCTSGICACSVNYTPSGSTCIPYNPNPPQYPTQLIPGSTCDATCQYRPSCQQLCVGGSICIDNVCTCPQGYFVVDNICIQQLQPTLSPVNPPSSIQTARPSERCNAQTVCIGGSSCILGICQCPPGYSPTADLTSCINNLLVDEPAPSLPQALPLSFNSYNTELKCNKTIDCPLGRYCENNYCKCSGGLIDSNGTCISSKREENLKISEGLYEELDMKYPGTLCGLNRECLQNSECLLQIKTKLYCVCPKRMVSNSTGHCTSQMLSDSKRLYPGSKCLTGNLKNDVKKCSGNSECINGYCLCPENYINNGEGFCLPNKMKRLKEDNENQKTKVIRERRKCKSYQCDDINEDEIKYMKTVPPGSYCNESKGIYCIGGSKCFKETCICPFGHLIHDLSCRPAPRVLPGQLCANGEICIGGSQCINSKCKCLTGTTIEGKSCLSTSERRRFKRFIHSYTNHQIGNLISSRTKSTLAPLLPLISDRRISENSNYRPDIERRPNWEVKPTPRQPYEGIEARRKGSESNYVYPPVQQRPTTTEATTTTRNPYYPDNRRTQSQIVYPHNSNNNININNNNNNNVNSVNNNVENIYSTKNNNTYPYQPNLYLQNNFEMIKECPKDGKCVLPYCFCSSDGLKIPGGLKASETPQMVILTFEGAITDKTINIFKSLFRGKFRNPNNCEIKGTFFISHEWNNYDQVQWLYSYGHEIAVNSITKIGSSERSITEWKAEMSGMREALERFSYIKPEKIIGVRAPKLVMGGDNQFKMMEQNRFLYDNSLAVEGGPFWPQTLDYKTSWTCPINQHCPKEKHPAIWQFPINEIIREDGKRVSMLRSAVKINENPESLSALLMKNFNRSLLANKAPYILTLDADFLESIPGGGAVNALEMFFEQILSRRDTFVVTMTQAIEWMQKPVKLQNINHFTPWECRFRIHQPIRPCEEPSTCVYPANSKHTIPHSLKICGACPAVYPWLNDPLGIDQGPELPYGKRT